MKYLKLRRYIIVGQEQQAFKSNLIFKSVSVPLVEQRAKEPDP